MMMRPRVRTGCCRWQRWNSFRYTPTCLFQRSVWHTSTHRSGSIGSLSSFYTYRKWKYKKYQFHLMLSSSSSKISLFVTNLIICEMSEKIIHHQSTESKRLIWNSILINDNSNSSTHIACFRSGKHTYVRHQDTKHTYWMHGAWG